MTTLYMNIGLPGSGKSFVAHQYSQKFDAQIFESDEYRRVKYGDAAVQKDNASLFAEMQNDMLAVLKAGHSVVFDATNIRSKFRIPFLSRVKSLGVETVAVVVSVPLEICLERNNRRSRVVPDDVIVRMWKEFQFPTYAEGFDKIEIEFNFEIDDDFRIAYDWSDRLEALDGFHQHNPHHTKTAGGHIREVYRSVLGCGDDAVRWAALLHDFGKFYTLTFEDGIGHFYGHENVGAYDAPFYLLTNGGVSIGTMIEVSQIVNYHMRPYSIESDKAKKKFIGLVGQELFDKIMILNSADASSK